MHALNISVLVVHLHDLIFQSLVLLHHRRQLLLELGDPPLVPVALRSGLSQLSEELGHLFSVVVSLGFFFMALRFFGRGRAGVSRWGGFALVRVL